jgi:hypothetical protein
MSLGERPVIDDLFSKPLEFKELLKEIKQRVLNPQYGHLGGVVDYYYDLVCESNDPLLIVSLHLILIAMEPSVKNLWRIDPDNETWKAHTETLFTHPYRPDDTSDASLTRYISSCRETHELLLTDKLTVQSPRAQTATSESPPPEGSIPM